MHWTIQVLVCLEQDTPCVPSRRGVFNLLAEVRLGGWSRAEQTRGSFIVLVAAVPDPNTPGNGPVTCGNRPILSLRGMVRRLRTEMTFQSAALPRCLLDLSYE